MKRAFLHSLAISFVLAFLGGIFLLITGNHIAGMLIALTCMLVAVSLLRAADLAPLVLSKPRRIAGWIAGLGIMLLLLAIIAVL